MMIAFIVWGCVVLYCVIAYFAYNFIELKTYCRHEICDWLGMFWFISLPTIVVIAIIEYTIQKIFSKEDTPEERF